MYVGDEMKVFTMKEETRVLFVAIGSKVFGFVQSKFWSNDGQGRLYIYMGDFIRKGYAELLQHKRNFVRCILALELLISWRLLHKYVCFICLFIC